MSDVQLVDAALVAAGAAVGASLRYAVGSRFDVASAPRGTFAVNVVGSFLLGLFAGLALGGHATALLGTGFCGGLTTFSSFAVQAVRLGPARGAAYVGLSVVACVGAAALGFVVV